MFAQLGNIKFELITYFNGIEETISYNYAEHERIENKSVLQFMGKNLQQEHLKLNFHKNFCNPEEELKKITSVADNAKPLKFIKGNGEYVGVFVIEEIEKVTEQASAQGDLMSIQVEIRLREYTGEVQDEEDEEETKPKGFKQKWQSIIRMLP